MKQLFKIALLTAVPFSVFAEGQQSAGLPQMDISTFPSQIFWLVVTFSILYIFMWKFVIPKLRTTIEERRDKISNDINEVCNSLSIDCIQKKNINEVLKYILKSKENVFLVTGSLYLVGEILSLN